MIGSDLRGAALAMIRRHRGTDLAAFPMQADLAARGGSWWLWLSS
jgi:hypothetical protein